MTQTPRIPATPAGYREILRRQQAGYAIMERERLQKLAELDYSSNLPILDGLLQIAYEHRKPQRSSGLLKLQRILYKQRETM